MQREKSLAASKIARDITERKQAEGWRRASEEALSHVVRLGSRRGLFLRCRGRDPGFQSPGCGIVGREPKPGDTDERFCGSHKMHRPDGTFMPHELCPMAEVLSGKIRRRATWKFQIERPDGSWVTVIVNIRALQNERGEITGRSIALWTSRVEAGPGGNSTGRRAIPLHG